MNGRLVHFQKFKYVTVQQRRLIDITYLIRLARRQFFNSHRQPTKLKLVSHDRLHPYKIDDT